MFAVKPPGSVTTGRFIEFKLGFRWFRQHCPVEKTIYGSGSFRIVSHLVFRDIVLEQGSVFPFGSDLTWTYVDTMIWGGKKTTEPRLARRGGLGLIPFEPWSGSFAGRTLPALKPRTNSLDMFFLAAGGNRSPVSVVYTVLNLYVLLSLHGTVRQSEKKESLELQPLYRWRSVHTNQEHSR